MIELISVGLSGQELVDKVNEIVAAINDMRNVESYGSLNNKPTINGVTVQGSLTLADLGIAMTQIPGYADLAATLLTQQDVETITLGAVTAAENAVGADLDGKVDKDMSGYTLLKRGYIDGSETFLVAKGNQLYRLDIDSLIKVAMQNAAVDGGGSGGDDTPVQESELLKVGIAAKTVPTVRAVNGLLCVGERVIDITVDTGIDEVMAAIEAGKMVMAVVDDLTLLVVRGYLYDGKFYSDANYTNEVACDEEHIYVTNSLVCALSTGTSEDYGYFNTDDNLFYDDYEYHIRMNVVEGKLYRDYNAYPSYDDCIYKCTRYLRWVRERFEEISYDDNIYGEPYMEGNFNAQTGMFANVTMYGEPYEGDPVGETPYRDVATGKTYAYVRGGFVACSIEDFLLDKGRMQITQMMTKANYVRFQLLDDNSELTFTGRRLENLGEMIDLWSMNVSKDKYEMKANKIQSIGKGSADLYPSEAAVIAYVQANS